VSRLRRIELAGRFFFITTNLARNVAPLAPHERDSCLEHLALVRERHTFSLFAYVVMPDHVHLLLWTVDHLLPTLMREWKSGSGFAIAKGRRVSGAVWQARYFDFILRRAGDFGRKLDYIHKNPVSAGLVSEPCLWKWSSAAFYGNRSRVPVRPDLFDVPVDPNAPLWPVPWR
jgi:REP-associated tyrosine transposase